MGFILKKDSYQVLMGAVYENLGLDAKRTQPANLSRAAQANSPEEPGSRCLI